MSVITQVCVLSQSEDGCCKYPGSSSSTQDLCILCEILKMDAVTSHVLCVLCKSLKMDDEKPCSLCSLESLKMDAVTSHVLCSEDGC